MPIGPNNAFIKKESVLARRASQKNPAYGKHLLGGEVSLLIEPDTKFIRKVNVLANKAGHLIY